MEWLIPSKEHPLTVLLIVLWLMLVMHRVEVDPTATCHPQTRAHIHLVMILLMGEETEMTDRPMTEIRVRRTTEDTEVPVTTLEVRIHKIYLLFFG